jgi:hypothetical protein
MYVCMYSVCVFFKHIQYTLEIQGLKKHVLMKTRRKWIKKVRPWWYKSYTVWGPGPQKEHC